MGNEWQPPVSQSDALLIYSSLHGPCGSITMSRTFAPDRQELQFARLLEVFVSEMLLAYVAFREFPQMTVFLGKTVSCETNGTEQNLNGGQ